MNVLVVDDEADMRDSLQELLEDAGFTVATAANGAEALEILNGEALPSVMILDLIMPVLSGNELYDQMQKDPRLSKIPVVISTSDPSRAPSGVLIMKKPVELRRLLGTVRRYCMNPSIAPPSISR
jgi:CheY-like chemotaxis protein